MTAVNSFVASLVSNAWAFVFILVAFHVLRRRFPFAYEWRMRLPEAPAAPQRSFLGWVRDALAPSEEQVIDHAGVDTAVLLRFLKMGLRLFLISTAVNFVLVLPLNATGRNRQETLEGLSMANVQEGSWRLWGHVVSIYIMTGLAFYHMLTMYREFIKLRHHHQRQDLIQNFCVYVKDIPASLQTEEKFAAFFRAAFPDSFHSATITRGCKRLARLQAERRTCVLRLHAAMVAYQSTQQRPRLRLRSWCGLGGQHVDAVRHYTAEVQRLNEAVAAERAREPPLRPSGFVCFRSRADAHAAAQVLLSRDQFAWSVHLAPEPRDIHWPTAASKLAQRGLRRVLAGIGLFFLTFFWAAPVAAISAWTTMDKLSSVLPFADGLLASSPALRGFLHGFLPTLALRSFMALLPYIVVALAKMQGVSSRTLLQASIMHKMHFFNVFNVLLVSTVAGSVFAILGRVMDRPGVAFELLGTSLPQVSTFFINYVMLNALIVMPMELLRVFTLIVALWRRGGAATATERREAERPGVIRNEFGYGLAYAEAMLIFVIGCVFSTIAPLILPFAALFFAISYVVYRYNALYVYEVKYDSAGAVVPSVMNGLLVGLVIFHVTVVGLFSFKGSPAQAACIVPLALFTPIFSAYLQARYGRAARFLPRLQGVARSEHVMAALDPEGASRRRRSRKLDRLASTADAGATEAAPGTRLGRLTGAMRSVAEHAATLGADADDVELAAEGCGSVGEHNGAAAYQHPALDEPLVVQSLADVDDAEEEDLQQLRAMGADVPAGTGSGGGSARSRSGRRGGDDDGGSGGGGGGGDGGAGGGDDAEAAFGAEFGPASSLPLLSRQH